MASEAGMGRFGSGLTALIAILVVGALLIGPSSCQRTTEQAGQPPDGPTVVEPGAGVAPAQEGDTPDADPGPRSETPVAQLTGRQLYLQHCTGCHGEQGDGLGVAAQYLFPKPRDLRAGRFRLVSTRNNVPTRADLESVLVRGMPGSAMPPWAHLSQQQRDALVDEVLSLWHSGLRDQYTAILSEEEELTDEEIAAEDVQQEIAEFVERRTTPGETTSVPAIDPPNESAIARGKEAYVALSCHSCHGQEGRGDGVQKMVDDEGLPTSPRDFVRGIFKGGHDPASLYRRVAYGMPGTPMPATSQATPAQMVDLVHFIRSLSDEPSRQAAILNRETVTAQRVDSLPESASDEAWSMVESVALRMTPLWWRNDADPDLRLQVVHDGQQIAVRASWSDDSADQHAAQSETFEDAVAVEFYRGDAEPFIGMGDARSAIDVWYWDADRQSPAAVEDIYPDVVVDTYPFSESQVETALFDRPGAKDAAQPDLSLPARASGNPIVPADRGSGASSLAVAGAGSVTFRIPQSQLVTARGQWHAGRWTVVMTRALAVASPQDGVSLEPGGRASMALAVWDGALRDRDGKKLITVWQDLKLER